MRALECQKRVTLTTSLRSVIRSEKMPVTLSHLQLFQTRVIAHTYFDAFSFMHSSQNL